MSEYEAKLRDEFAGLAMQGDWATQSDEAGYYTNASSKDLLLGRAELFYRMADAMLEARKK
jgi:hypothetical protein